MNNKLQAKKETTNKLFLGNKNLLRMSTTPSRETTKKCPRASSASS